MNILVLLLVALYGTVPPFRRSVDNLVAGIGTILGGAAIGAVVVWVAWTIILTVVGFFTGSAMNGFVLGLFTPLIGLLMVKVKTFRYIFLAPVFILLVYNLVGFCIGLFSPTIKRSMVRRSDTLVTAVANGFNKSSLKSEKESGIFAYMETAGPAYATPDGKTVFSVGGVVPRFPAGEMVRPITLDGQPVTTDGPEGMTQVMLKDTNNDFVTGPVVWVPSRRLKWREGWTTNNLLKSKERWETVAEGIYNPDRPWKEFAELEEGDYRMTSTGDYGLYFEKCGTGEQYIARYSSNGELWTGKGWDRQVARNSTIPVQEGNFGGLVAKVDSSLPMYIGKDGRFRVWGHEKVLLTLNIPTLEENFTKNKGGFPVKIERRVTS